VVDQPLISIVIPAHNAARFLGATLDSVLAQHEERWECVVIDDRSSDDTLALARRYEQMDRRIHVYSAAAGGPSAARNHGFRHIAEGSRYVSFMDSDDVWLPHALATLVARLETTPGAIGSHGLAEFIDTAGAPLEPGAYAEIGRRRLGLEGRRLITWPLDRPTCFEVLANGNVLFPPGLVLARRDAYERAGPFDETLSAAEDWDMLIRLSRFGDIAFANDVILLYRRHDQNLGARETVPEQAWRVRCIAFHAPENSPAQRRIARRGWRAYQVHTARQRLGSALSALREHRLRAAALLMLRLPVHALRYVRGYPLPRARRELLTW
jgi:glycosyltransferase involved in cell wall biosynthesis